MFLFFDFFAKTINSDSALPRDLAEARREASIVSRRLLKRRARQQAYQAQQEIDRH